MDHAIAFCEHRPGDTDAFAARHPGDWIPENHIAHFILETLEVIPESAGHSNWRGSGSEQFPPRMMLGVLIYSYVTGRFSSREIERATYSDVAMRFLSADTHPDHRGGGARDKWRQVPGASHDLHFPPAERGAFQERLCQRAGDGGRDGAPQEGGQREPGWPRWRRGLVCCLLSS